MTARQGRQERTSRLTFVLAVGSSATVATSALVGHNLTTPELAGALGVAGAIGVLSYRSAKPQARPHVLSPMAAEARGPLVAAPRARELVTLPAAHSDAA